MLKKQRSNCCEGNLHMHSQFFQILPIIKAQTIFQAAGNGTANIHNISAISITDTDILPQETKKQAAKMNAAPKVTRNAEATSSAEVLAFLICPITGEKVLYSEWLSQMICRCSFCTVIF